MAFDRYALNALSTAFTDTEQSSSSSSSSSSLTTLKSLTHFVLMYCNAVNNVECCICVYSRTYYFFDLDLAGLTVNADKRITPWAFVSCTDNLRHLRRQTKTAAQIWTHQVHETILQSQCCDRSRFTVSNSSSKQQYCQTVTSLNWSTYRQSNEAVNAIFLGYTSSTK